MPATTSGTRWRHRLTQALNAIELAAGALCAVVALTGLAIVVVEETIRTPPPGGLSPVAVVFLTVIALAAAGVAVGAYLDTHADLDGGQILLVGGTMLLLVLAVITVFSIGLAVLPAAGLAIIATAAALVSRLSPDRRP